MRHILLAAREEGVTFDGAWEQAMAAIPPDAPERRDWLLALEATRGAWNVAYRGERLPVRAQAVVELEEAGHSSSLSTEMGQAPPRFP